MGDRSGSEERELRRQVLVRLDEEAHELLAWAARRAGVTPAAYLRSEALRSARRARSEARREGDDRGA